MADEEMIFMRQDEFVSGSDDTREVQTDKFLIFESDGLTFGARVEYVVEIITNHTITPLPIVPDYISGIINLRGLIVPVVDIRVRLGKPHAEDSFIIILEIDGTQLGITVDSVDQMVDVPRADVLPMPAHNTQKLLAGMCSLPGGKTMLVLDCALLLET